MTTKQIDPKYSIRVTVNGEPVDIPGAVIEIVNMTGVPIPDDEPLTLFRGRDRLALPMHLKYLELAIVDGCTDFHIKGIENRIDAFTAFAADHPERMKQPGVTEGL